MDEVAPVVATTGIIRVQGCSDTACPGVPPLDAADSWLGGVEETSAPAAAGLMPHFHYTVGLGHARYGSVRLGRVGP